MAGSVHIRIVPELSPAFENLGDLIHEFTGQMIRFLESFPTKRQILYRIINKPWETHNWALYRGTPSRRRIREARSQWDSDDHARWARKLLKTNNTEENT